MKQLFPSNLRRVTTNGLYISEIDGLRFISIVFVLICHLSVNYFDFSGLKEKYITLQIILEQAHNGVRIFFSISGFILMHNALLKMEVKNYYIRRFLRIEPPYLISLVIIYFISFHRDLASNLYHLLFSIPYLHSIVYGIPTTFSSITWSLEVEMQFYLTFPLLFYVIQFCEKKFNKGIWVVFFIIVSGLIYNHLIEPHFRTLLDNLTFFYTGVLVAFVLYYYKPPKFTINPKLVSIILIFIIVLLIVINSVHKSILLQTVYLILIFLLFLFVLLFNSGVRFFLRSYFVSITGGMCYTIYLYHIIILNLFNKYFFSEARNMPFLNFLYTIGYLVFLWIFCSILFLLFEKPFMGIRLKAK